MRVGSLLELVERQQVMPVELLKSVSASLSLHQRMPLISTT